MKAEWYVTYLNLPGAGAHAVKFHIDAETALDYCLERLQFDRQCFEEEATISVPHIDDLGALLAGEGLPIEYTVTGVVTVQGWIFGV